MSEPAVSVVVPTRDRPAFLAEALRSVFAQEDVELEVVVVDDADRPGGLMGLPGLRDPRVRVLGSGGVGVSRARNAGVEASRAEWIAFLDDDDRWAPRKLRAQLDLAERTGAGFVHCGVVVTDEAGRVLAVEPADGDLAQQIAHFNLVRTPSTVLARRAAILDAGGFAPELAVLADWDLWLALVERVRPAAVPDCLVAYLQHAGSMSVERVEGVEAELAAMKARHGTLLARTGGDPGGAAMQEWIATGLLRSGHHARAAVRFARVGLRYREPRALAWAGVAALGPLGAPLGRRLQGRRDPPPPAWLVH